MKLSIGIFFGGLFGALGILVLLVAFGSDYWLLAREIEKCSKNQEDGVCVFLIVIIVILCNVPARLIMFIFFCAIHRLLTQSCCIMKVSFGDAGLMGILEQIITPWQYFG